jgi:uncharacterized protein YcfL
MKVRHGIGLAVLVLALAGCATSGIEAIGKPTGDPQFAKHLVVHNETLAGKIIITKMNTRFTGDLLEVDVVLSNLSSSDKSVQYQFSWFDENDFEVEQGSRPWVPITLHGNASVSLQAVAPNASVKTYKINIRDL